MIFDSETCVDKFDIQVTNSNRQTIKEEKVRFKKYLGLIIDHQLKFDHHIDYIKNKIAKRICAIYVQIKKLTPTKIQENVC